MTERVTDTGDDLADARLQTALSYAARGWHLLPVGQNKRPRGGIGLASATTDERAIRGWFQRWPNCSVALACKPSGVVVIDCDRGHADGADGVATFEALAGPEPHGAALIARTPKGGEHRLYATPDGIEFRSKNHVAPGVDVKASGGEFGGYVVLPSGSGADGRSWLEGDPFEDELTPPPAWLVDWLIETVGVVDTHLERTAAPPGPGKVTPAGTVDDVTLERVRSALLSIPSTEGRDIWLKAIYGAKDALLGDERGAEIVESWSSQAPAYDERTQTGQYRRGEAGRIYRTARLPEDATGVDLVSEASLFDLAIEHGWEDGGDPLGGVTIDIKPKSATAAQASEAGRPVNVSNVAFHDVFDRCLRVLAGQDDVLQAGGRLCRRIGTEAFTLFVPLSEGEVAERLSRAITFTRQTGKSCMRSDPPRAVVAALVEKRPTWPLVRQAPRTGIEKPARDWTDLLNDPPMAWLVRGWLPAQGVAALAGKPGDGKSVLLLDACLRGANGQTWFGHRMATFSTLYFAGEGEDGMPARMRAWKAANPEARAEGGHTVHIVPRVPRLNTSEGIDDLHRELAEFEHTVGRLPNVVVLDTWALATAGGDENSAGDAGLALAALRDLAARGILVVVVHHVRKVEKGRSREKPSAPTLDDLRGSGALGGNLDVALMTADRGDGLELWCVKARDGQRHDPIRYAILSQVTGKSLPDGSAEDGPIAVPAPRVGLPKTEADPDAAADAADAANTAKLFRAVAVLNGAPTSRDDLCKAAHVRAKDGRSLIARAIGQGELIESPSGRRHSYSLPGQPNGVRTHTPHTPRDAGTAGTPPAPAVRDGGGTAADGGTANMDWGQPEGPKGKGRKSKTRIVVEPERVQPGDADYLHGRREGHP